MAQNLFEKFSPCHNLGASGPPEEISGPSQLPELCETGEKLDNGPKKDCAQDGPSPSSSQEPTAEDLDSKDLKTATKDCDPSCSKDTKDSAPSNDVDDETAPISLYTPRHLGVTKESEERLKLCVKLVQKAQEKLRKVTEERDLARGQLKEALNIVKASQQQTKKEVHIIDEKFREMRETELGYLTNVRRKFEAEKRLFTNYMTVTDKQKKNTEAQLRCKKEQLEAARMQLDKEINYQDVCKQKMYSAISERDLATQRLKNKLWVGENQYCGQCKARLRVAATLENQIVKKSEENDRYRKEKDNAVKRASEKERIAQILLKENERLKFELSETKKDLERKLNAARLEWELRLEESMQAVASETPKRGRGPKTPSPTFSDTAASTPTPSNLDHFPQARPVAPGSSSSTPNPFANWARKPSGDASNPNLLLAASVVANQQPAKPGEKRPRTPSSVGGKTPGTPAQNEGQQPGIKLSKTETELSKLAQQNSTGSKGSKTPPSVKSEPIGTAVGSGEGEPEEGEAVEGEDDPPGGEEVGREEWLEDQLGGYETLTAWYRKHVKSLVDDLEYFHQRVEEDTQLIEEKSLAVQKREIDYRQIRRELERSRIVEEQLRGQLKNLADSVSNYFGTGHHGAY